MVVQTAFLPRSSLVRKTASFSATPESDRTISQDQPGSQSYSRTGQSKGKTCDGAPSSLNAAYRSNLSLGEEDIHAIGNVKKAGIPVVVILISGRPMIITDVLPQADAFLAAFLPGTEGQGIADVLFGDYKPAGKLSFSWPKSMDQLPLNINIPKDKYDPLFPYGFGLSY